MCAQCLWCEGCIWCRRQPHFPQGVLTTIILIGSVAAVKWARACAGCEAGLPLCSVAVAALWGVGSALKLLQWMPWGLGSSRLCSFKCVFFLLPTLGPFPQRGECWSKWSSCAYRGPICDLCGHPWLCSDTAQILIFSPVVVFSDLVQSCGME